MSEKKKYWLKIEKDFLNSSQIKVIKNMPNGKDYIIFYLAIMLESTNSEGHLRFNELVPYNEEMLASVTDTNVDIVRTAMKLFQGLGLIQILQNGTIFLPDVPKRVGKESESAERVRLYREKLEKKTLAYKEPKSNAVRQKQYKAKKACEQVQHIPYIEDYANNKRYGGNYYVVFKRDKMKCSMCQSIDNLCVHHIDGYDELKLENNNENKMITLCRTCHQNVHAGVEIPNYILESIDYFDDSNESNESCNNDVTNCNDNKEKEEEKEKEEKEDKHKQKNSTTLTSDELLEKISLTFKDLEIQNKFIEYADMRKAKGKRFAINTQATFKTAVDTLNRIATTKSEQLEVLNNSILNGWQGLFPVKHFNNNAPKSKNSDLESAFARLSNG